MVRCFDGDGRIKRWFLYLLFTGYLYVNIFEGIVLNVWTKNDGKDQGFKTESYTAFNQATFYVFDALLRFFVCLCYLLKYGTIMKDFKKLSTCQFVKLFFTRLAIQASEQLQTLGSIYLTPAAAQVVSQLRIPLVGFLGFIMFRIKLSQNQLLFASSIIPLAIQFSVRDLEDKAGDNGYIGFIVCSVSVFLLSLSNVLVENILKNDFESFTIWSKQFIMATIDIPIMIVLWFLSTTMEKYAFAIDIRTYNPFDKYFAADWYMIILLAVNAALWGAFRLCILNWGDALWLNLACVFVMGVLWIIECSILKTETGEYVSKFFWTKLLGLFALTIILIGYELASWVQEEITKQSLTNSLGGIFATSQEISTENTTPPTSHEAVTLKPESFDKISNKRSSDI